MLKGKQKKLDKNNNGRIDAEDFKLMKASTGKSVRGYGAARTSGSGLLDEQMAPGKVMNARVGKSIDKKAFMKTLGVFPKINKPGMGEAKDYKKYLKGLKEATKSKSAKKASDIAMKAAKSTRLGKIALGIAGAGIAAKEYLKRKKEKEEMKKEGSMKSPFIPKKMGGGMMNKPMGYKSGSKLMDFIKSGSYTDKYGTKTNVDKAIKKINLSPKDKDLATMKPASNKKMMGGGMMKKYSKGGGADTGTVGEEKSKFGVATNKARRFIKKAAEQMKDTDRFTERDIEKAKQIANLKKFTKRMGGGMMNKPMGYKTGGGYDAGTPGKFRDMIADPKLRMRRRDLSEMEKRSARKFLNKERRKEKIKSFIKSVIPGAAIAKGAKALAGMGSSKPSGMGGASKRGSINRTPPKKIEVMEARKGQMVMARGCKLGRKKATKIT